MLARFGNEHRVHFEAEDESVSMVELYVHLFRGLEHDADLEQWRRKNAVLHNALHDKLPNAAECPVCASSRLRRDTRWPCADWSFKAIGSLWDLTARTIRQYGTGWQAWRPARMVSAMQRLPPKLLMEDIPRDQIQELPGGVFKWGQYQTNPGTENLDAAWAYLNPLWHEDRILRINLIRDADAEQSQSPQKNPGDKLTLGLDHNRKIYSGRVWRSDEQWVFQEDDTGIQVKVAMNICHSIRQHHANGQSKLYRAMHAEHTKRRQARIKAEKREAGNADVPKTTADMAVKCTTHEGKLVYTWGDADKGRIEVLVTPKKNRKEGEDTTKHKQAIIHTFIPWLSVVSPIRLKPCS